ncbi:PH (Pleckstrin Homology) domain-containing protein [Nocardia tenerifensis]|uniref:PH (Pleckstrin Homology) domain-containing protein n=1 Tax=Nocardia tenerifensis TaxID=228006 RepID=A0A318JSB7_9NOCA|nr:PH domain-containing protein [Nocardia tenerifensis]PXX57913.1 PH (Pleckstrin Homology) domain-containing protein [Nocardia tenerifensis]
MGVAARNAETTAGQGDSPEWDLVIRPRRAVRTARIVAAVIAVAFLAGGIWLRSGSTGVNFRVADQLAMIGIGLLIAAAVLLLTRPRVRVGPSGVSVRNILGDSDFPWETVRGVAFPDKKSWARLELVNDDYVPLLAIRSNDKERAAQAMDRLRELGAKYTAAQE